MAPSRPTAASSGPENQPSTTASSAVATSPARAVPEPRIWYRCRAARMAANRVTIPAEEKTEGR